MIVARNSLKEKLMLRQRPTFSINQSHVRCINAPHMATDLFISLWLSSSLFSTKIPTTTLSKNSCRHWSYPNFYQVEVAKHLRKNLEREEKVSIFRLIAELGSKNTSFTLATSINSKIKNDMS